MADFTHQDIETMLTNLPNQNRKLRQEIEKMFPELNDSRKTEEQIEQAYQKCYENVLRCLLKRNLVSATAVFVSDLFVLLSHNKTIIVIAYRI